MERYKEFDAKALKGRERRLLAEWRALAERFEGREDIEISISRIDSSGLPIEYYVEYNIRSICGVSDALCSSLEAQNRDDQELDEAHDLRGSKEERGDILYADRFLMVLTLPPTYPCIDGAAQLRFVDRDRDGEVVARPWHPNIRYFGNFAGRVCLNAMDSFVELAWCVERVALYLNYELYHSIQEPPYPEDLRVARWLNSNIEQIDWRQIGALKKGQEI